MLNERQRRFVNEYMRDFNQTRAAARAGYHPDHGRHVAHHPAVAAEIERRLKRVELRLAVDGERVVEELMRLAFSDIRLYLDIPEKPRQPVNAAAADAAETTEQAEQAEQADGVKKDETEDPVRLKSLDTLAQAQSAAIAALLPQNRERGPVLRLHDKRRPLRALARHVGLTDLRDVPDPAALAAAAQRLRDALLRAAGLAGGEAEAQEAR